MNKTQGKVHSIISNLVLVRTEGGLRYVSATKFGNKPNGL